MSYFRRTVPHLSILPREHTKDPHVCSERSEDNHTCLVHSVSQSIQSIQNLQAHRTVFSLQL